MNSNNLYRAAIFSAAGFLALSSFAADRPAQPAPSVLVEKVVLQPEVDGKKFVGRLEAIEEVDLVARVSGYINSINFKEGDIVKKGDLLFELEDTTYRAKEQAAKAKVDQIKAELEYAKINYDRQSGLYKTNAVAKNAFDEADKLYKTTQAQLAEAEASLLDARNDLSYTKVYAPISGRIGKVTYTQGNYVTPGSEKLADIVQVDPIYASFAISERDFRSMFNSDVATMKKTADIRLVLADDTLYPSQGTVAFIDNKIDSDTGTVMIWATFPNKEGKLLPGAPITVQLSRLNKENHPAVKLSAIMTESKGSYIYIVTPDNKVERREVKLGNMNGSFQLLKSGAKAGETVIVDGTHKAQPGAVVRPIPAPENF